MTKLNELNDWVPYWNPLQEMVGGLFGFPVEMYWVARTASGVGTGVSYQVMPTSEAARA